MITFPEVITKVVTDDSGNDVINIPIRGGITEGGLIIICILVIFVLLLAIFAIVLVRYGSQIRNILKTVQADTAQSKVQLVNDHTTNLREELTEFKDEVIKAHKWTAKHVQWLVNEVNDLRQPTTRRSAREHLNKGVLHIDDLINFDDDDGATAPWNKKGKSNE